MLHHSLNQTQEKRQLFLTGVSVEKVPQLMLVAGQCSGYKQARVRDAAVERYIRRPAAHDGTPIPLRSVVLLLPPGRSGSENHLLRLIDRHVSLEFIRAKLKGCYSDTGRPSIDPELLLRMLLIGYLYGVTSERKLVEELRMHLAWRWFTGLGFDQEIPHHSTFSKNRHGRFQQLNLFQEIFEEIVARCVEAGLVKGEHMSVDGSFIQANADHHSRVPPEQLAEVAKVNHTVREYLVELERENPVELPVAQQEKVSTRTRIRPTRPKAVRRGSAITTTIQRITAVASSWGYKLRRRD